MSVNVQFLEFCTTCKTTELSCRTEKDQGVSLNHWIAGNSVQVIVHQFISHQISLINSGCYVAVWNHLPHQRPIPGRVKVTGVWTSTQLATVCSKGSSEPHYVNKQAYINPLVAIDRLYALHLVCTGLWVSAMLTYNQSTCQYTCSVYACVCVLVFVCVCMRVWACARAGGGWGGMTPDHLPCTELNSIPSQPKFQYATHLPNLILPRGV